MSKNKFVFGIALFALVIAMLPIANAQILGLAAGNWLYILINAFIIGAVLFLLQSFIVQNKPPKEKAAVWMIIIVLSLFIAFQYGRTGFIWQTGPIASYLDMQIIGNTLIIGSVFYILFALIDRNGKILQSPQSKIGFGIMLFLIAIFIAVKLGPDTWVWEAKSMDTFIEFLFNSNYGILNPDGGLYVFLSSMTLFVFFFNGYLLPKGAGNTQIINYILAFLFASTMASYGASMNYVIALGQVVLFLVLLKALKDNGITNWWVYSGIALVLIGFATWAVRTGTCAAETCYGGIETVLFGVGSGGGGLGGSGIGSGSIFVSGLLSTAGGSIWGVLWRLILLFGIIAIIGKLIDPILDKLGL